MTPKEKAQELYHKYFSMIKIESPIDRVSSIPYVKKCALIVVDEILLIAPMMHMEGFGNLTIREYFKKVKQEIEAL